MCPSLGPHVSVPHTPRVCLSTCEWPEAEKAEKLARGAALKWASAVFYCPDKLEGLGHYRSREAQRTSSIQSRLKSTVQSHLEGVSSGLEQLSSAAGDVRSVRRDLCAVRWHLLGSAEGFQGLAPLRAVVTEHRQLAAVVRALPQLSSVHELLAQSLRLLRGQQLLEAHAGLMALERLRDDISSQLHCGSSLPTDQALGVVESFFGGLQELSDALAQQLWHVVAGGVRLVQEDPALFVSAVRIIEREESADDALLLGPPWRQRFYQVMQETIAAAHFKAAHVDVKGPGLGQHLAALQSDIPAELRVVKDLMVQCCPPHYDILSICTRMYHQGLSDHLQDILSRDLDKQEIFMLLSWVLHVYHSPEMMGHPDLLPEVDVSTLGPLVSPEVVEQLERKYVGKVKVSDVTEWMRRTLEVEFKEWFREEEPEMDHLGFFQSALPVIVMQVGRAGGWGQRRAGDWQCPVRGQRRAGDWQYTPVSQSHHQCHSLWGQMVMKTNFLLAESEHLVMNHYVRALMEKKMVCRSAEERSQLSTQLLQDASQLRELFHSLGLAESEQTLEVIVALQELIRLQDPALLSLEVLGFMTKYPDISDEHVSILLDLRGDVSKEVRNVVLEMMAQNPQSLPENYQPIFSNILVPAPELPFCLRKAKCA
uniref:Exocyst complex component 3 like 1 n=1 Tax=Chelydra serpentina TaxID=8475 RepID=A0A8C3SR91_CHESE